MAIEKLTKQKLIEYKFDGKYIEELFKAVPYRCRMNNIFATNIEKKIYSGKDLLRLDYFPEGGEPRFPFLDLELLPEYVENSFKYLIQEGRKKGGAIIVENGIKQRFIDNEIEFIREQIIKCKKQQHIPHKRRLLKTWEYSLDWFLDIKINDFKIHAEGGETLRLNAFNFFKAATIETYNGVEFILENARGDKFSYSPHTYCDYILEQYLENADTTSEYEQKVLELKKAEDLIKGKIERFNLKNCTSVLDTLKRKLEFIELQFKGNAQININYEAIEKGGGKIEPLNPHSQLFISGYAYNLFLAWHDNHKEDKSPLANYSYIIRRMIKDKLISDIKQSNYLEFLSKFGVSLSKLKTLSESETLAKTKLYLELKKAHYTPTK